MPKLRDATTASSRSAQQETIMEKEEIESAADEIKADKKLPDDSEMQKAVERSEVADRARRALTPAELHADGRMI
jgi:hypothetical protein